MTLTLSLSSWRLRVLALSVVAGAALAIAVAVGAFTSDTKTASTGTFSVGSETTTITVTTLNAATGLADPGWTSCKSAANMAPSAEVYCIFDVKNNKISTPISYSLTSAFTGSGALADRLLVGIRSAPSATDCNASLVSTNLVGAASGVDLSALPFFGDPAPGAQTGDRTMGPGSDELLCLKVVLNPAPPRPYSTSLSATLTISGNDGP